MTDIKAALKAEIDAIKAARDDMPFGLSCETEEMLAVMEDALKALEQRDAQIAALAKQQPVSMRYRWCPPHLKEADGSAWIGEWKYCDLGMANPRKDYERQELFTRAALPVPVKLPSLKQTISGERYVWSDAVYNYQQDVIGILKAAGVVVEVADE